MSLDTLEERFHPPSTWTEDYFNNPATSHRLRYGHALIENASGHVVLLGGLSEFAEKYFETMRNLNNFGLNVSTMDWAYQGLSSRYSDNPHKRSSDGYDTDISDLNAFIKHHVLPLCADKPLYLIAHSMGGHIGLRYIAEHTDVFQSAIFSAPMIGIQDIQKYGRFISPLLRLLSPIHTSYVPGGTDWHEAMRRGDGTDIFSSDPARDSLHNFWCLKDPRLQVGNPTLGWLWKTVQSIHTLSQIDYLQQIRIPVILCTAEAEKIVDNTAIERTANSIPNARHIEIKDARHELLMESDVYRMQFFKAFEELIKQDMIQSH